MSHPVVFVVDDDQAVREGLALLLEASGLAVECHESAESFLAGFRAEQWGCLLLDVRMPGMSGLQLQDEMLRRGWSTPVIFLTAHGDIPMSVRAIKAGAMDFLTKPVARADLLARVEATLQSQREGRDRRRDREAGGRGLLARLTQREAEILRLAVIGHSNKDIGARLGISFRTVEIHRSHILRKTGTSNMLELAGLCRNLGLWAGLQDGLGRDGPDGDA